MKILIATDVSIFVCEGRYYYASQVSTILKRYYEAFGTLSVCGRVTLVDMVSNSYEDVTNMIENVIEIPSLEKTLLGKYNQKIQAAVQHSDFIICRCPSVVAFCAADVARKYKKPYFAEAMGCAWDAYWNHGIVGKVAAPYMFFKMKHTIYHADYALYVTNRFLQHRYPCKNESIAASNVKIENISEKVLEARLERIRNLNKSEMTIATTAAVDVRYKGQEYVIKAIPKLNKIGIKIKYLLIGGGDQSFLKNLAKKLGVQDQVEFAGRKTLNEVFDLLDKADIYIQPSLQEGLPRSVIEAMSRGCICMGAHTAGIPELLEEGFVVARKSVTEIVNMVENYANSPIEERLRIAERNFWKAKEFESKKLDDLREVYFKKIITDIQR